MHKGIRGIRFLTIALCLLSCLAVVVGAAAQGMGPTSTWLHIQNLSTTDDANCRLEYFNQNATVQHTEDLTIPAGGTVSRDTRIDYSEEEIPSGWRGSLVMYCSEPVAAVSDQYYGEVQSPYGSSVGYAEGALQVDLPIIFCDWWGWHTNFHVQNAGSEATTVSVEYVPSLCGVSHSSSIPDLGPGASQSVDQSTMCEVIGSECPSVGPPDGEKHFMGSVTLTASQPIVAVVNEEKPAAMAKFVYDGLLAGASDIAVPLIMARHVGFYTGVSIQNRHSSEVADIEITYQADTEFTMPAELKGSTKVVNHSIEPGATLVRYEEYGGTWCELGPNGDGNPPYGDLCEYDVFVGSATIESTYGQPLVAIVNEENTTLGRTLSFNGVAYEGAGKDVAAPLIMYNHDGWLTGMSIQNLGSTTTSVTITYTPDPAYSVPSSGTVVKTFDIGPGDILLRYEAAWSSDSDLRDSFTSFVGSARIISTTENVAAIVQPERPAEPTGDWTSSYNGIYP